jgi:hypothetical protein
MTSGTLLGGLVAGTIISLLGIGQAFILVCCFYTGSLLALLGVPATAIAGRRVMAAAPNILRDFRVMFGYLRGNHTFISILGVTVIMNFVYFPFTPMVPVFADRLNVNAFWTGLLASGPALGSMCGTLLIARGAGISRGWAYVGGSLFALVFLFIFAASEWYLLSLVALVFAGVGTSGFATMQTALTMITAEDEMRGRALGLLSMAIGALPFGMLILGGVAQAIGPSAGVTSSVVIGVVLMASWMRRRPEAQRLP